MKMLGISNESHFFTARAKDPMRRARSLSADLEKGSCSESQATLMAGRISSLQLPVQMPTVTLSSSSLSLVEMT